VRGVSYAAVPRLYNEEQLRLQKSLEIAVRRVEVSCETVVGRYGCGHTEAEEATTLEAVTRRQPVKIQQTVKAYCVLQ
jgi:carbonic anhydrase